ncbi:hypothetical protein NP233_g9070 [Leucocoprinus birnbaumii]|uniref:Uncharacterized protein n=1 Tax=Leucocoprinus birnbaumii TaxID=56174 RepID=A0AAD5YMJ9_9AGAR|nr:hypothetical protein NP233_g9070 [Leucocoprinus birnbaumii]
MRTYTSNYHQHRRHTRPSRAASRYEPHEYKLRSYASYYHPGYSRPRPNYQTRSRSASDAYSYSRNRGRPSVQSSRYHRNASKSRLEILLRARQLSDSGARVCRTLSGEIAGSSTPSQQKKRVRFEEGRYATHNNTSPPEGRASPPSALNQHPGLSSRRHRARAVLPYDRSPNGRPSMPTSASNSQTANTQAGSLWQSLERISLGPNTTSYEAQSLPPLSGVEQRGGCLATYAGQSESFGPEQPSDCSGSNGTEQSDYRRHHQSFLDNQKSDAGLTPGATRSWQRTEQLEPSATSGSLALSISRASSLKDYLLPSSPCEAASLALSKKLPVPAAQYHESAPGVLGRSSHSYIPPPLPSEDALSTSLSLSTSARIEGGTWHSGTATGSTSSSSNTNSSARAAESSNAQDAHLRRDLTAPNLVSKWRSICPDQRETLTILDTLGPSPNTRRQHHTILKSIQTLLPSDSAIDLMNVSAASYGSEDMLISDDEIPLQSVQTPRNLLRTTSGISGATDILLQAPPASTLRLNLNSPLARMPNKSVGSSLAAEIDLGRTRTLRTSVSQPPSLLIPSFPPASESETSGVVDPRETNKAKYSETLHGNSGSGSCTASEFTRDPPVSESLMLARLMQRLEYGRSSADDDESSSELLDVLEIIVSRLREKERLRRR